FTDEELINYSIRDGKMNFEPGTSQQYSHTDNVILGQVIQRATKQSMKELYDKNIFGPLGMKDTEYPVDQSIKAPVLHAFTIDRRGPEYQWIERCVWSQYGDGGDSSSRND